MDGTCLKIRLGIAEAIFGDPGAGNYRLSAGSPCVNAGINQDWMTNAIDLGGNIRIRYGAVDMGSYECIYDNTLYNFR